VFDDPVTVVREVLRGEPSPELLARLEMRRGRRSATEQPSIEQRAAWLAASERGR
jgi:hypothetical protein